MAFLCLVSSQDALIDMVRRSKVHFVHCLLPKAEAVGGGGEPRVTHGENMDLGLMTLDVGLLRAQLRGSKLLDALRIYRQGKKEVYLVTMAAPSLLDWNIGWLTKQKISPISLPLLLLVIGFN